MRVGKNSFPGHAGNGVTGALRTAGNTLGLSRALFIPWKIPKTGRIRPKPLSGAGTPPPPRKWDTQQLTGGHVGGSRFRRRLATRWRSAASSSSASWRS